MDSPLKLSIGLGTGDNNEWFESAAFTLKKGWNKDLTINLTKKEWRSAETSWEPQAIPKNLQKIKKFAFVFDQGQAGKAYLDNIPI